jgi:hypothetical protein
LATLPGAVKCGAEENDYEFEKGIIFEDDEEKNSGGMAGKLLGGLFSGRLSFGALKDLVTAVGAGNQIYKQYMAFPERAEDFEGWVAKAEALWKKAEIIADLAERDLALMGPPPN